MQYSQIKYLILSGSEVYRWLKKRDNFLIIKAGFDSTSRYARLQDLHVGLAGRLLFMRFVASTGDAMGMNMVSKVGFLLIW